MLSDAREGIKAAVSKVLSATWQRCRVHFMRNLLAHAGKSGRRGVPAFIATAFAQNTAETASSQWRAGAGQIRPRVPKLATIMDDAEPDVLACMTFPKEYSARLHATNPIERLNGERLNGERLNGERLNGEIKRRTDVAGVRAFLRTNGGNALTPQRCRHPATRGRSAARPVGALPRDPWALCRATRGRSAARTER